MEIRLPDPPLDDGVVRLRELDEGDVPAITAACQDEGIARFTTVPSPYSETDAQEFVTRQRAARKEKGQLNMAVARSGESALVGMVGLFVGEDSLAEVGYWIANEARGGGLAPRAVSLLTDWAFTTLGLARVQLITHPDNRPSQRVAEKAGFRFEGTLRSYRTIKGERWDCMLFARLPEGLSTSSY